MEELEKALEFYATGEEGVGLVPEFVEALNDIDNLSSYVAGLNEEQKKGEKPVLKCIRCNSAPLHQLELYWNPVESRLDLKESDPNLA